MINHLFYTVIWTDHYCELESRQSNCPFFKPEKMNTYIKSSNGNSACPHDYCYIVTRSWHFLHHYHRKYLLWCYGYFGGHVLILLILKVRDHRNIYKGQGHLYIAIVIIIFIITMIDFLLVNYDCQQNWKA